MTKLDTLKKNAREKLRTLIEADFSRFKAL